MNNSKAALALLVVALTLQRKRRRKRTGYRGRTSDTSSAEDSSSVADSSSAADTSSSESADSSTELSSDEDDQPISQGMHFGPPTGNVKAPGPEHVTTVHHSIQCSQCGLGVTGFRYKCVQCADCDLCAACEARGAHPYHYMLRIPRPLQLAQAQVLVERVHCCLQAEGLLGNKHPKANNQHMINSSNVKEEPKESINDGTEIEDILNFVKVEPDYLPKAKLNKAVSQEQLLGRALKPAHLPTLQPTLLKIPTTHSRQLRKRKPDDLRQEEGPIKLPTLRPKPTVAVKAKDIAKDPLALDLNCQPP